MLAVGQPSWTGLDVQLWATRSRLRRSAARSARSPRGDPFAAGARGGVRAASSRCRCWRALPRGVRALLALAGDTDRLASGERELYWLPSGGHARVRAGPRADRPAARREHEAHERHDRADRAASIRG